ncbi:MAG TPA: protease pro-enzyme activation domain-containing protein, partial [Streptosporangiaceae bacterium]|nr:protease pro-enzyme activation domain-containing protein [Streptosporangiaceae bacterium]
MTEQSFVPLAGSERSSLTQAEPAGPVDASQRIELTLITSRRAGLPAELVTGPATLSREELAERHGTDPADLTRVREVLAGFGIEVTGADAGMRRVTVAGTVAALSEAFGAQLRLVRSPRPGGQPGLAEHRYREGGLRIPAELGGIVTAVLGLDDRPQARAQFRHAGGSPEAAAAAAQVSYTPPQVASAYR